MKRSILVVVALIAVLALGLPPVIGGMTQSSIETRIAGMNENPVLALQVADYSRGWFSSDARIVVGLDEDYVAMLASGAPADDPADSGIGEMLRGQQISIDMDVWHGPVILAEGFYIGLSKLHARFDDSDEIGAMITDELGMPYVAELRGQLSFANTFSFTSNVPPIEYFYESGQVSFSGLTADGSSRGAALILDAAAEKLLIEAAGTALTFENFSMIADSTRVNSILWAGEFGSMVERISVVNTLTGMGSLDLSGVSVVGSTNLNDAGDLFDARVTYQVDELNVPEEEMRLTDSQFTVSFGNISVAALTEYYETMLTMDMADPAAAAMALPPILASVLANDPTVALDPLSFTLNGESLTAAVSLRTVNGDQGGFDLNNPLALLGMLEASASLTAAKALLERLATQAAMAQLGDGDAAQLPPGQDPETMAQAQTELMIATFLGQGYIVDDGDNYSTDIQYANGEIRVNGTPLPLGALMQ